MDNKPIKKIKIDIGQQAIGGIPVHSPFLMITIKVDIYYKEKKANG